MLWGRQLYRRGILAGLVIVPLLAQADVTYNGSAGVYSNIFNSNSQSGAGGRCLDCHDAGNLSGTGVMFHTYANAVAGSNETLARDRINAGTMPPTGSLNATEMSLITQWVAGGAPEHAAPDVSTDTASSITKYSATLNGDVNENGIDTSFYFQYGLSAGSLTSSTSTTSAGGTGGGLNTSAISRSISSLSCGTTYHYRNRTDGNGTYGAVNGSTLNFNTLACPTISNITNRTIDEDSTTGAIAFSLTDNGSSASCVNLTVTASSSNTTVVPNGNISVSGSTCSRTITVTPAANQFGSTTITVAVDDEDAGSGANTSDTFTVTVNSVNDVPVISDIVNQGTTEDTPLGPVAFTISDLETAAASLLVSATSSNTALVPNANISFGGSGGSRNLTITPAADATGSTTITVTVSDGVDTDTDTFTLVVSGVNDNPTISNIVNQTSNEDVSNMVGFTVADNETAAGSLTVTASSSNTSLIPNANLIFGGSGSSRTLTATPVANASGSATITVTVRDELFASAVDTYTLTITAVNDAPVLAAIANQTVTELSLFALSTSVVDPDDADDGSGALTYSLLSAPTGMSIDALGNLSWTPGEDTANSYPITVRVADGGENGAAPSTASFTLTVQMLDTDSDTVADYDDNCPATANTDQANNDADTQGDLCDSDDDNDGLPDTIELARGLDPFDPSDAAGDLDGDGLTNLEEYQNCVANGDPVCDDIVVDSVAPVITTNGDLIIPATGYVTNAGETATAEDGVEGPVAVSADIRGPFRPGLYVITWTAQDTAGNIATEQQEIRVLPRAEIASTIIAGEGQPVRVPVYLNGEAPSYPVYLVYSVSGTANNTDHNLNAGTITISSGTSGVLEFTTQLDAVAESDESIVIQLTGVTSSATLGDGRHATVTIVDRAIAPIVELAMQQGGDATQEVFTDFGEVVVEANAFDANNDALTYQWQISDDSIAVTTTANQLRFDPSSVATGSYFVSVTVNDAGHQVSKTLHFHVAGVGPSLTDTEDADGDGTDDLAEGLTDSDGDGVLDYRDPVDSVHQLQVSATAADRMSRLLITEPGLQLAIGAPALAAQRTGARVASSDLTDGSNVILDTDFSPVGEIYSFRVSGLNEAHPDATVIIPLMTSIPPDAVYRKLINGRWQTFSTSNGDTIHSAPLQDGLCPAMTDDSWRVGLNRSDNCVRLRIRDGGINDADGLVDGEVSDPGTVALAKAKPEESEPDEGPNGGGGVMAWTGWAMMIALMSSLRFVTTRRRSRGASV